MRVCMLIGLLALAACEERWTTCVDPDTMEAVDCPLADSQVPREPIPPTEQ